MILDGAREYWSDKKNLLELDQEWQKMGDTRILEVVLDMFQITPLNQRTIVAEIGCGTGRIIDLLDREFVAYHAYDQSKDMLDICKAKHIDDERIHYRHGVVGEKEIWPVDVLLCIEVLQHQDDPIAGLKWLLSQKAGVVIATLAISDPPKTIDLNGKPGTRTVSFKDIPTLAGLQATAIAHDQEMSTWILRYENMS